MLSRFLGQIGKIGLKLNPGEYAGIKVCVQLAIRNRALAAGMLATGVIVAILEGSTIGIIILAVNVLIGNQAINLSNYLGAFGANVDSFINRFDQDVAFLVLVGFTVAAQIAKSGTTYLSRSTSIRLGTRVAKQLQEEVTRQIMTLSYSEVRRYASGSLNEILRWSSILARMIINTLINRSLLSLFLLATYLVAMFAISMPLTLTAIVVTTILSLSLTRVVNRLQGLGSEMTSVVLSAGRVTIEYLNAPRLIRVFSSSVAVEKIINRLRLRVLSYQQKLDLVRAGIEPAIDAITICGVGLFLVGGFVLVGDSIGEVLPTLLIFLFILNRMMPQVKNLNSYRMSFASIRKQTETVGLFLQVNGKEFTRAGGSPFTGLRSEICFREVRFSYPGAKEETLKEVDFCIEKGQMVALVGSSGAGKSTISDLVLGLHRPSSGSITVDGIDLQQINNNSWLHHIGVVDQEVFLINATIRDNICFTRIGFSQADVEHAARIAHAHDFICKLDNGYDTIIGDRGYRLSGGEQQRLTLARALLTNPEILILDEATSSLDSESEALIQGALLDLHQSRTILLIAHRLSTVAHADQILVIEKGQVVERGTKVELLENNGRFYDWWELQSHGNAA